MRIHLIAIGGAAMHNLAIALHCNHHTVSGSDDEIYEPSRTRLEENGLLPPKMGWFPEKISAEIDVIILGMHAKRDNPELLKAQEIGLKIYSYPEYIAEFAKDKSKYVIAGSHGKTTTTAMLLHVTQKLKMDADYLVGAQLEGFDTMVRLSDAPIMIIEGDEYLSSPIDPRPKIFHYKPQVAVITGIAWDHVNVFPTFDEYLHQFNAFITTLEPGAKVIYYAGDAHLPDLLKGFPEVKFIPYEGFQSVSDGEQLKVFGKNGELYPISIFGQHNLQNLKAAALMAEEMGIEEDKFLHNIKDFKGASKRLQLLEKVNDSLIFMDFAHAPSKVGATVQAVKARYPDKQLIAVVELHTFSSLNKSFLPEYKGALDLADLSVVFYQEHTLEMKGLPMITPQDIIDGFQISDLKIFVEQANLVDYIVGHFENNCVLLLMSSGNFGGLDVKEWAKDLTVKVV